jgi:hypothetical protein
MKLHDRTVDGITAQLASCDCGQDLGAMLRDGVWRIDGRWRALGGTVRPVARGVHRPPVSGAPAGSSDGPMRCRRPRPPAPRVRSRFTKIIGDAS